jgi:hypothetical protein
MGNEIATAAGLAAVVTAALAISLALAFTAAVTQTARKALCDERGGFMSIDTGGRDVCLTGATVLRFDGLRLTP